MKREQMKVVIKVVSNGRTYITTHIEMLCAKEYEKYYALKTYIINDIGGQYFIALTIGN